MSRVSFQLSCAATVVILACAGSALAQATYDFVLINQYQQADLYVFEYDLVVNSFDAQLTAPITDVHFQGPAISPGGIIITPPPGWLLDEAIAYDGSYYIGNVSAGDEGNYINGPGTLHGWKIEGHTATVQPGSIYMTQFGNQNGPTIQRDLPVSIPEPATAVLLAIGAMLSVRRRR